MSGLIVSLPVLMLLLVSFETRGISMPAHAQSKTWCVAKPSTSDAELIANMEYACEALGDKCRVIDQGDSCFSPNTRIYHASVAKNMYYQMMGNNMWNCDFRGTGLITLTDPGYGSCY